MAAYNTNDLARIYRKARGVGENALSMLTSGFAEPAAGYAAAAAAATGYDAEGARNAIRERMTYAPKTAEGIQYMNALARVMSAVNNSAPVTTWKKGVDIAGRYSPTAGAVLASVPTAIGVATGAKSALQQGRSASILAQRMQEGMVRNAMVPRKLHPQAGVVDIWGELLDADNIGGRSAAKAKAQEMIKNHPEMKNDIIGNYNDLGYSDMTSVTPDVGISSKKQNQLPASMKSDADDFDVIKAMIQDHYDAASRHQTYGYRIIPDDMDLSVGDYLPDSFRWDDGVNTGEALNGTSAIGIEIDDIDSGIRQAQKLRKKYLGKKHAIIATERYPSVGEDDGELVLPDARVVGFVRK